MTLNSPSSAAEGDKRQYVSADQMNYGRPQNAGLLHRSLQIITRRPGARPWPGSTRLLRLQRR